MSFNNKLKERADVWVQKNIISDSQKVAILEDVNNETSANSFFKILSVIASVFIGAGAILIISSNWAYLPKAIKLLLILLMPVVSVGGGYFLSYVKHEYQKIGNAFIILGSLLIGASLALLGQLYNLDGSVAGLLLWWFVLSLPLTLLFKSKSLAAISVSLVYASLFYFITDPNGWWVWGIDEQLLVRTFTLVPVIIIAISEAIKTRYKDNSYHAIAVTFEVVSLKILLLTLFIGTIGEDEFWLFGKTGGSELFQNILFLGVVFFVMWYANKRYLSVLRHSAFFWLAAYMVVKYFAWFWDYMDTGIFFVLFGIFLLGMVVGYIKFIKYLKHVKEQYRTEARNEVSGLGNNKE